MLAEEMPVEFTVSLTDSTTVATSLTRPAPDSQTEDLRKPVALLVSHGMGQQVPFATLASVVELLQGPQRPGAPVPTVTHIRFLDPDGKRETWLPRAELQMTDPKSQTTRTVHVYETYWAPLTEGNISLSETVRFLASAGWERVQLFRGGTRHMRRFQRWLFGHMQPYEVPGFVAWGLIGALALVVALVVINTILTLVVGANLLGFSNIATMPAKLVDTLTVDLLLLLAPAVPAGLMLKKSMKSVDRRGRLERKMGRQATAPSGKDAQELTARRTDRWVHRITWGLLGLAGLALLVMTFRIGWHYFTLDHTLAPNSRDTSFVLEAIWWLEQKLGAAAWPAKLREFDWDKKLRMAFIGVVWGVTVYISLVLRGFLVQYLGDVAIYLDAYKVDKFHKVREEVKRQAYQTACALYGARAQTSDDPTQPLPFAYDRVVLIGHSLGSVVTYDALNATLHLDESMNRPLLADVRTGGLITFGSPLNKTAYIFSTQTEPTSVRPPLTASVQPLLRSWRVRHYVRWINIYSKNDVVSDSLTFYDAPKEAQIPGYRPVENRIDEDARTPLAAHTQYWDNQALAKAIEDCVFDTRPEDPVDQAWRPSDE